MSDSFFEDQFSSYDIDYIKAKSSAQEEQSPSVNQEDVPLEPLEQEQDPQESEPIEETVEHVYTESPEMIANKAKVEENKAVYDKILSKFSGHEPHIANKEDVEKAIVQMNECIAISHQLSEQENKETSSDRRQLRKRRIVSKQLAIATDAFITASLIGACYIDIDKTELYQHLENCHYFLMTSQTSRTFRTSFPKIFEETTVEQSRTAINKIITGAERLSLSLAEIIDSFPSEGGMSALLEMMVQKGDDNVIETIGNTIRMAAKGKL